MRHRLIAPAFVAMLLLAGAPARAETTGVVFTQGSTYVPGDTTGVVNVPLVHLAGHDLLFTNLDPLSGHSITSEGFVPGTGTRDRLFDSDVIAFRASTPVHGVADLAAGVYPFLCSIHGGMAGALEIVG